MNNINNVKSKNSELSTTMTMPAMAVQSQSTTDMGISNAMTLAMLPTESQSATDTVMRSYVQVPQFTGIQHPAPFSQLQQEPKRRRINPQIAVNGSMGGTSPVFFDGVGTTEQTSTASTPVITPPTNNITFNDVNISNTITKYPTPPKSTTFTLQNVNGNSTENKKNNNTIKSVPTPASAPAPAQAPTPTPTPASAPTEVLAPLNREGKNLSEKKIRRLEKNRLSARNCRRKKKEVTLSLQNEINILEGENLRLRLQLKIGAEAEQSSRQEQERVTESLNALLKSGASEAEIYSNIEEFKEKFADYGRDCRSAIDFHLRNVRRLLMPTTTTNVAMRALRWDDGTSTGDEAEIDEANNSVVANMARTISSLNKGMKEEVELQTPSSQSPSIMVKKEDTGLGDGETANTESLKPPPLSTPCMTAATPTTTTTTTASSTTVTAPATTTATIKPISDSAQLEPKALFQYLVSYLNVTPAQAAALKDSRHVSQELDDLLKKSIVMLGELEERLAKCGEDLAQEFSTIRSILTPRQAAKFLVWVANNSACMHMLNELWSKVYPEPVVDMNNAANGIGQQHDQST